MRQHARPREDHDAVRPSIPFPKPQVAGPFAFPRHLSDTSSQDQSPSFSGPDVLEALGSVSRRISDLARELNCLGFFHDDDDRPRAA